MLRSRIGLTLVSAVVLATAVPARGDQDYCIDTLHIYLFKEFKIPKAGECTPVSGFQIGGLPNVVSGAACTASDGGFVTFGVTTYLSIFTTFSFIRLELPSQTGNAVETVARDPDHVFSNSGTASREECPSPTPPLP
jgi:hypothetical protein